MTREVLGWREGDRAKMGGWGRTMESLEKGSLENSHWCCRTGVSVSHPDSTCPQWLAWKKQGTMETDEAVGDGVEGLTVGRGSQGLTWGCRSDGWKMTHHHHMTCCSHPMESTGPRPHLHLLAETQRGHTLVCSTTGGRMREGKGKGRNGMSVTLQSSGFNASFLSTIPQITGAVHSGMGVCDMRKGCI